MLNANYLLARLRELVGEHLPLAFGELLHARVRPVRRADEEASSAIRTLDLAKRLLDHGFHPPTVYFPLLVDEALLIEPTETETKETLDALRRRDRGDPARGGRGPGDRPERAVHDAGAPPGRGRRGQAPGHPRSRSRPPRAPSPDARRSGERLAQPVDPPELAMEEAQSGPLGRIGAYSTMRRDVREEGRRSRWIRPNCNGRGAIRPPGPDRRLFHGEARRSGERPAQPVDPPELAME